MLDGPESRSEFARLFDAAAQKQSGQRPKKKAPPRRRDKGEPANWVVKILELILDFFV
jgi:hypothetical protein